jgi:hypothetical protein
MTIKHQAFKVTLLSILSFNSTPRQEYVAVLSLQAKANDFEFQLFGKHMQSYKSFQSSILENTQQHNLEELRTKVLRIDKLHAFLVEKLPAL